MRQTTASESSSSRVEARREEDKEQMATKKAAEKPGVAPVANMTKTQIISTMTEKLALEPKQVQTFFDVLIKMAMEQTREAGEFTVPGLRKLVNAERKERMGRNPATGEQSRSSPRRLSSPHRESSERNYCTTTQGIVVASDKNRAK